MYILFISRGWPSERDPQWGNFERDQAEAMKAMGHKVVVVSVDQRMRFYCRKIGITHKQERGIDVYDSFLLPSAVVAPISRNMDYKIALCQFRRTYKRVVKEHGHPDVIYSHYLYNTAMAVDVKKKYGVPVVAIEHWSKLNADVLPAYIKKLGYIAYESVDKIIAVSNALAKRIEQHFKKESTVINNMINQAYCDDRGREEKDHKKFTFITIGSLIERKGYDLLIRAFHQASFGDGVEMKIIGRGELRDKLQAQISSLSLDSRLKLMGQMSKEEMIIELDKSDAFVLSSHAETFGVVVAEALSAGLPCVATICGGPEEIVTEENGILIRVNDVEALSAALREMYERVKKGRYDREVIIDGARAKYSPEVILRQTLDVFEEVLR